MNDPQIELRLTALHESAHAVVAASLGQRVHSLTIRPTPGTDTYPGSLGQVCLWPLTQPRPRDLDPRSAWIEHSLMVDMAGYALEEMVAPESATYVEGSMPDDYRSAAGILRCVTGKDPDGSVARVMEIKAKVAKFLSLPVVYARLLATAEMLLRTTTVRASTFYQTILGGQCGYYRDEGRGFHCKFEPNGHAWHEEAEYGADGEYSWTMADPLGNYPFGPPKVRASAVTTNLRRLREVNQGGPGYHLSARWKGALDRYGQAPESSLATEDGLIVRHALEDLETLVQSVASGDSSFVEELIRVGLPRPPARPTPDWRQKSAARQTIST